MSAVGFEEHGSLRISGQGPRLHVIVLFEFHSIEAQRDTIKNQSGRRTSLAVSASSISGIGFEESGPPKASTYCSNIAYAFAVRILKKHRQRSATLEVREWALAIRKQNICRKWSYIFTEDISNDRLALHSRPPNPH